VNAEELHALLVKIIDDVASARDKMVHMYMGAYMYFYISTFV
jgi:hypothetical protein